MVKFENLEYDIKKMLMGDHAHESLELRPQTAHRIVSLAKNMATHTLDMVNHKPVAAKASSDHSIRMSEIGEPCIRKLYFKWFNPMLGLPPYADLPEPFLPVKFTYGDYIEELTLFLASESGHKVEDRQKEVELHPAGTDWYAVGHMDAKIDGVVVDVKSAADVSFQKYRREGLNFDNDSFGYRWQIDAYATAEGTDRRAFIFTNKHDGHLHIIDRTNEELLPVGERIRYIGEAMTVNTELLGEKMPVKATRYGSQLNTVCSYCNFKYACYAGGIRGVIDKGRPAYFVEDALTKEGEAYLESKPQITKPKAYRKESTPLEVEV